MARNTETAVSVCPVCGMGEDAPIFPEDYPNEICRCIR